MIWRSTLLNTFKEISHGFVSKPFSFPFMFKLTYLPSYVSFFSLVKVPPNKWVIADQVHGTSIYIVGKEKNKIWPLIAYKTDALITQERKRPLIMFFADCIPIFIYVPRLKVVGIIHSGWRGTIRDFPLKALTFLISNYNL
ncbi:MAG: laccase domain-containing protein, partial [Dictyoglomus sp.]